MTLVGYWPLNEEDGDQALDYSGNENHGTLEGGVTQGVEGILGTSAYGFDGSQEVRVEDDHILRIGDSQGFTYTAWVKTTVTDSTDRYIMIKWDGNEGSYYLQTEGGEPGARINGLGSLGSQADNNVTDWADGEWHFAVCVYNENAGQNFKMFIDGQLEDSITGTISGTETSDLDIGHYERDNHFSGSISEIRTYNRALTQSEIQYLYSVSQRGLHNTSKKQS